MRCRWMLTTAWAVWPEPAITQTRAQENTTVSPGSTGPLRDRNQSAATSQKTLSTNFGPPVGGGKRGICGPGSRGATKRATTGRLRRETERSYEKSFRLFNCRQRRRSHGPQSRRRTQLRLRPRQDRLVRSQQRRWQRLCPRDTYAR